MEGDSISCITICIIRLVVGRYRKGSFIVLLNSSGGQQFKPCTTSETPIRINFLLARDGSIDPAAVFTIDYRTRRAEYFHPSCRPSLVLFEEYVYIYSDNILIITNYN